MSFNMRDRIAPETEVAESTWKRAKQRLQKTMPLELGASRWLLPGLKEFGDAYDEYELSTDGNGLFYCSCYDHYGGEFRQGQVCSHSAAVALHTGLPCQRTRAMKEKPKEPERLTPDRPADIPGIPDFYSTWRPGQREAVEWLVPQLKNGGKAALDAPTGSGKSLTAIAAAKLAGKRALVVVSTKQLEMQYHDCFPDAVVIFGRDNYPCPRFPGTELTAASCTHRRHCPCPKIDQCPYRIQKRKALAADLAIVNYAFFLNEANHVGAFSGWELIIFDEADLAEGELMKYVSVTLTRHQLEQCGIEPPEFKTKPEAWIRWAR